MAEGDGWDGLAFTDSQNLGGDTFAALGIAASVTSRLLLGTGATNPATRPQSIEDEVLANIQHQRIGSRTVADDHLPGAFLSRIADRI